MKLAYIGLGSNLADPRRQVECAFSTLAQMPQSRVLRRSSLYATPPWGRADQPEFVNAVAEVETALSAPDLLAALLAIERGAGRVRDGERWGPRVLDLDILVYGAESIDADGLQVPHPRLKDRAFALLPLAELAPQLDVPGVGRVEALLPHVDAHGCVRLPLE